MAQLQALYHCRQSELYTICLLAWVSNLSDILTFAAFSAAYDAVFNTQRRNEILAAKDLPDYQARNADAEVLRTELEAINSDVLLAFLKLKRYITYAFPSVNWQTQFDAAGQLYYDEAFNSNWDSATMLLESMTDYLAANSVALLANANMPAGFAASVTALETSFNAKHISFLSARQAVLDATEEKVAANNQIYTDLLAMLSDAKLLGFSEAHMAQYTFARLLTLVSGAGLAGVQGAITSQATGLPIPSATFQLVEIAETVMTDGTGHYELTQIPSGTYSVLVTAPNPSLGAPYIDYTATLVINKGAIATLNVAMAQ